MSYQNALKTASWNYDSHINEPEMQILGRYSRCNDEMKMDITCVKNIKTVKFPVQLEMRDRPSPKRCADAYFLDFLSQQKDDFIVKRWSESADLGFVTNASTLHQITKLPFEKQESRFNVQLHNGAIYCFREMIDFNKPKYKHYPFADFVQIMTDSPSSDNFYGVYALKTNNNRVIYSTKIDAIDAVDDCEFRTEVTKISTLQKSDKIVAIKMTESTERDDLFKNYKSYFFTADAFFQNASKILVGYRRGNLLYEKKMYTKQRMIELGNNWSPNIIYNLINKFVTVCKSYVEEELEKEEYHNSSEDQPLITFKLIKDAGLHSRLIKHSTPSNYTLLPDWYSSIK